MYNYITNVSMLVGSHRATRKQQMCCVVGKQSHQKTEQVTSVVAKLKSSKISTHTII